MNNINFPTLQNLRKYQKYAKNNQFKEVLRRLNSIPYLLWLFIWPTQSKIILSESNQG